MNTSLLFVFLIACLPAYLSACSIYVLPLFKPRDKDLNAKMIQNFLHSCAVQNANKMQELKLLLPKYTSFTTCYTGSRGDCDSIAIQEADVTLKA